MIVLVSDNDVESGLKRLKSGIAKEAIFMILKKKSYFMNRHAQKIFKMNKSYNRRVKIRKTKQNKVDNND